MFSTKERDFSTGLDYFGFRYYDAVLGKFTTRDPSGYPDGPNNYLYVNNNPINMIDPWGLSQESTQYFIDEFKRRERAGQNCNKCHVAPAGFGRGPVNFGVLTEAKKFTHRVTSNLGDMAQGFGDLMNNGGYDAFIDLGRGWQDYAADIGKRMGQYETKSGMGAHEAFLTALNAKLDESATALYNHLQTTEGVADVATGVAEIFILKRIGPKAPVAQGTVLKPKIKVDVDVKNDTITGYRAVSDAEHIDIHNTGLIRPDPAPNANSMDFKWFSETNKGAEIIKSQHKDLTKVVEVKIPKNLYDDSYKNKNIDRSGPGFVIEEKDLPLLKPKVDKKNKK